MEEQQKNIGDAFMEAVMNKIEKQDKKIADMEKEFQGVSQISKQLDHLLILLEKLNSSKDNSQTVQIKSAELLAALQNTKTTILQTKAQPIQHHHHFPRLLWATIGLFIVLALVGSDLYMTYKKMGTYKANDIKYRFLKLDTSVYKLQQRLYSLDTTYNAHPDFETKVIEMEEERALRLEQLSREYLLRKELERLEKANRQKKTVK